MRLHRAPATESAPPVTEEVSTTPHPAQTVTVLAVSPFPEDHARLQEIFRHSNWRLFTARACPEALAIVRSQNVPVVITEGNLSEGCWTLVLELIESLPEAPRPRLIVASRLADDRLWSQVLNLGGYNVLEKPFDAKEVFWVVSHAWLDWKSELERASTDRAAAAH